MPLEPISPSDNEINKADTSIPKMEYKECTIGVRRRDGGLHLKIVDCGKSASYSVNYKLSKGSNIKTHYCCTYHKNKFVDELIKDSFAELMSVNKI